MSIILSSTFSVYLVSTDSPQLSRSPSRSGQCEIHYFTSPSLILATGPADRPNSIHRSSSDSSGDSGQGGSISDDGSNAKPKQIEALYATELAFPTANDTPRNNDQEEFNHTLTYLAAELPDMQPSLPGSAVDYFDEVNDFPNECDSQKTPQDLSENVDEIELNECVGSLGCKLKTVKKSSQLTCSDYDYPDQVFGSAPGITPVECTTTYFWKSCHKVFRFEFSNTSIPKQNGCYFADDILIFIYQNFYFYSSFTAISCGPFDNKLLFRWWLWFR